MAARQDISPSTKILDDNGYDWAWAFVIFRDIPGHPGYAAGSDGSIWGCKKGGRGGMHVDRWHRMTPRVAVADGYLVVQLSLTPDKQTRRKVHYLVGLAFNGPRPPGLHCRHLDGHAHNNRADNLRWGTRSENMQDAIRHGTFVFGDRHPNVKLSDANVVEVMKLWALGWSQGKIGARFGVDQKLISLIVRGKHRRRATAESSAALFSIPEDAS
jgi:hypothetical protein